MATNPSFIATPVIGVGAVSVANTDRDGTGTLVDIVTAASSGTRVLEIVAKATGDPADCTITLFLNDGSTSYIFDEIDMGNPAAGSTTVASARFSQTYANLVLPSGWKLQAAITVANTSGVVNIFAFGGSL